MSVRRPEDWFELSGGALCLDFANTVSDRPTDHPIERLETYADLLDWAQRAGILTGADARRRADAARRHPRAAVQQLAEIKEGREQIHRLFADLAAARDTHASLDAFTTRLRRLLPETTLRRRSAERGGRERAPAGGGAGDRGAAFKWSYAGAADDVDALLWPVWWSAAELLASGGEARLRACEARDCGWLFLDASRGHRRRWCNMRICGNREKLRRFRAAREA